MGSGAKVGRTADQTHNEGTFYFSARAPSVNALQPIVSRQQTTIVTKTPFQPDRSAIQPTPEPAIAEPKTYPKKPVNPAAVPAAFFGTRSSACNPMIMIGP